MQSRLCDPGYAVEAMQSNVLEAFGSVLGAFGGVLGAFWGQARPAHLRRMVAGWPPDGQILSGGVARQAGGQEAEETK